MKFYLTGFVDEIDVGYKRKRGFIDNCKVLNRRKEVLLIEMVKIVLSFGYFKFEIFKRYLKGDVD